MELAGSMNACTRYAVPWDCCNILHGLHLKFEMPIPSSTKMIYFVYLNRLVVGEHAKHARKSFKLDGVNSRPKLNILHSVFQSWLLV